MDNSPMDRLRYANLDGQCGPSKWTMFQWTVVHLDSPLDRLFTVIWTVKNYGCGLQGFPLHLLSGHCTYIGTFPKMHLSCTLAQKGDIA